MRKKAIESSEKKAEDLFGNLSLNSAIKLSAQESERFVSSASKEGISLVLYTDRMAEIGLSSSKPPAEVHNYCDGGDTVLFTGPGQFRAEIGVFYGYHRF